MTCRTLPLLLIALAAQSASACSIPVFRYALEHWRPDPFMVVVFHRDDLTDDQIDLLERMESLDAEGRPTANVMVKAIDVDDETDPSLLKLWELQETITLPWMAVHAPARSGPPQRMWAGEFRRDVVDRLLDSPARGEVAERLLAGDSVAWVYLETGDAEIDDTAFELLNERLAHLETTLRLPEIEAADFGELSVVPEALRLTFSALRISRDDLHESQFVNMLLHQMPDIDDNGTPHAPIAIPVFGRGRAYDALVGDQLTPQSIEDACRFLTGACQCTVKAQNPGVDLLMSVDWDRLIQATGMEDDTPPPLVGLDDFAARDVEADADADVVAAVDSVSTNGTPPDSEFAAAPAPGRDRADHASVDTTGVDPATETSRSMLPLGRNTLLVLGGLLIAVMLGTLLLVTRGK